MSSHLCEDIKAIVCFLFLGLFCLFEFFVLPVLPFELSFCQLHHLPSYVFPLALTNPLVHTLDCDREVPLSDCGPGHAACLFQPLEVPWRLQGWTRSFN